MIYNYNAIYTWRDERRFQGINNFIVQDALLQSIRCTKLNSSPRIVWPIKIFVQRAQTGRGKFISSINV